MKVNLVRALIEEILQENHTLWVSYFSQYHDSHSDKRMWEWLSQKTKEYERRLNDALAIEEESARPSCPSVSVSLLKSRFNRG